MPDVGIRTLSHTQALSEVGFKADFVSTCPVPEKPFVGKVLVEYGPKDRLLEFISVETWLKTCDLAETLEGVTTLVFQVLWEASEPRWLRVRVEAVAIVHGPAYAIKDSRNASVFGRSNSPA